MKKRYLSDSNVQCNIEKYIFDEIKKKLLCENLQSNVILTLSEENNIRICPDFYSEKDLIIGEIHTHLGRLKPAQLHKIEGDILKMLLFEKGQKGVKYTKMIVVCDIQEYVQLQGKSFVAEAIRQFDIKLACIPLKAEQIDQLKNAMKNQNLYSSHNNIHNP